MRFKNMDVTKVKEFLLAEGYRYEKDDYDRDSYIKNVVVDDKDTKVEVFVDYYTTKIVWWRTPKEKVGTSISTNKVSEGLFHLMLKGLIDGNKEKRV